MLPAILIKLNLERVSMPQINKEEAKKRFYTEKRTYPFIAHIIDSSIALDERTIDLESFNSIMLFPWNDWGVFNYMHQNDLLNSSNKLCTVKLIDAVSNYNAYLVAPNHDNYYDTLDQSTHTLHIEHLKKEIAERGYVDEGKHLLIRETDAEERLYAIDSQHRLIAYEDLIQKAVVKYVPLRCVIGKVEDIIKLVGRYNLLGKELYV